MGPMTSLRPKPSPGVLLDAARRELSDEILRGEGGSAALERYSSRLDALILQLAADAPPAGRRVVIAALGGFGRRQLCLHSDIDLLVVFDGQLGEQDELFLRALLHPLWDAGLVVGHQVRELDELARLEVDNPEFLLALSMRAISPATRSSSPSFRRRFIRPRRMPSSSMRWSG